MNMPANMLRRPVPISSVRPTQHVPSRYVDLDAIAQTAALLATARRPCLLAGHGVELSGASDALLQFAQAARVPVMTSPKGKGVFPETDPLSVGVLGFGGQNASLVASKA